MIVVSFHDIFFIPRPLGSYSNCYVCYDGLEFSQVYQAAAQKTSTSTRNGSPRGAPGTMLSKGKKKV